MAAFGWHQATLERRLEAPWSWTFWEVTIDLPVGRPRPGFGRSDATGHACGGLELPVKALPGLLDLSKLVLIGFSPDEHVRVGSEGTATKCADVGYDLPNGTARGLSRPAFDFQRLA